MSKEKVETSLSPEIIFGRIKKEFHRAGIDETDGLRLEWNDKGGKIWLHIRASNTEPVFRIIGESGGEGPLKESLERIRGLIKG